MKELFLVLATLFPVAGAFISFAAGVHNQPDLVGVAILTQVPIVFIAWRQKDRT